MSELLSIKEIAKKCGTTENAIYGYIRRLSLKKQKVISRKFYYEKEVVEIIQKHRANGRARWYSDYKETYDET